MDSYPRLEDWHTRANCFGVDDPEVFFPPAYSTQHEGAYSPAAEYCADCPVAVECLAFALDNRVAYGMWGGLTPNERDVLLYRKSGPETYDRDVVMGYIQAGGTLTKVPHYACRLLRKKLRAAGVPDEEIDQRVQKRKS